MHELRALFPIQITRGALLRPDGVAVGLVSGGAPSWDLMAQTARAQAGDDYHRLLLALDAPLDLYQVDQPLDLEAAIAALLDQQRIAPTPLLRDVLGEIADTLAALSQQCGSRSKQIIWAVAGTGDLAVRGSGRRELRGLLRRGTAPASPPPAGQAALAQAVERARRLTDALVPLGGVPPARLLEAEEIAQLLYALADPVRAQRYPPAGALLGRVRRVVTTGAEEAAAMRWRAP